MPQFIDVEDKIFGPITTRQFIILISGGLMIFIAFKLTDMALFIFLLAIIGGLTLVLAFVRINGQPFHYFLLNLVQTVKRPSRRVWIKRFSNNDLKEFALLAKVEVVEPVQEIRRMSYNRIRDLSLIVNTGGYYGGGEQK